VYGFVKQSRGHVKIYSEVGEGTTVKIYLPRHHSEEAETNEQKTGQWVPRGGNHETILVVEDDEGVRSLTADNLRELGYDVLEAPNARSALQLLESHPEVAVIFTDVGLPGMNGRQLIEEARKRRPTLKALFTTGYARNAIVHEGRLDPGVELLTKPFTHAALGEKIRDIIDAKSIPARILLVEDEPLIQMLAKEYLEECGIIVETAMSASEALNKLRLIPGGADALVLDIGLPDRKGDALVREVRSIYPSLPIVIASGQGLEELQQLFKGLSSITFVKKPYNSDDMKAAIRSIGIPC
jgi:CheY-like chemotaxis protein